MKTKLAKVTCFAIVAASLIAWPAVSRAEDSTNAPAAQTPVPKKNGLPFHGNVAAVDSAAMTFTVGSTTVAITSTTKITKNGEPAVFADIAVGEAVRGYYKKDADGKLNATTVKIGGKNKNATAPAGTNAPPAQ